MNAAVSRKQVSASRRAMIAKVHLARKELGIAEEDYRAILQQLTGRSSCSAMSDAQLDTVIEDMKRRGWKQGAPTARRVADSPMAKKARALWLGLHQLGVVRNGSEQALEAFARRQLGCDRMQWADQGQAYRLIEALKAMAQRAGWDQDVSGHDPAEHALVLQRRLAKRLHVLLRELRPSICGVDEYSRRYPGFTWLDLWLPNLRRMTADIAADLAEAREG